MDIARNFRKIMEKSGTNKIFILTNHYKISGDVFDCNECNNGMFINLTNASLCTIENAYADEDCECEEYSSFHYDWLHVNFDNIVAFSFMK